MQFMTDALKGIEPQEVVGQIIASPKVQLAVGATTTAGGGALVKASIDPLMLYMGIAASGLGIVLTILCIVHRAILINKDLKDSTNKE